MNAAFELEEEGKDLSEYIGVFKRRQKQFLVPAAVVFVLSLLVALLWPPTYQSSATILIEEQQVPRDLVPSTITSYAAQQIEVIQARIMTMKNIMGLIEKYKLYTEDELRTTARTDIVAEFVEDVSVEVLSANVIDPATGRPTEATIAFELSYKHKSPQAAQGTTNELVNLFLNENLKDRTERSSSTSLFLKAEAESLTKALEQLETDLAKFKTENEGSLPELYQYNLQVMDRSEQELLDLSLRIKELEKRKLELESQLVPLSPYAPTVLPSGEQVLSDYDRLKSLQSELRRKTAIYSNDHPDVSRLKREISELEASLGAGVSSKDYEELLRGEQDKLEELRQKYTPDHPEVLAQQRVVEQMLLEKPAAADRSKTKEAADNPAYVLLETQLKANETEIQILKENQIKLKSKIARYEEQVLQAPAVEKRYNAYLRDVENTTLKYQEIKAKLMAAELAEQLEQGRKGERFTLIDPPALPEKPVSPNRIAIVFVGAMFALGIGAGVILAAEALAPVVRGQKEVTRIVGVAPLVEIPYIFTDAEFKVDHSRAYKIAGGVAVSIVVFFIGVHLLYKPLDVIWFIVMRKLGLG